MTPFKTSGDVDEFAQEGGRLYRAATDLNREDFRLRALKYPLLRLSTHGLSPEDQKELVKLGKIAFEEGDVTKAADKITSRKDAHPIAVAIAHVVASAQRSKTTAMLGAVIGAHAAHALSRGHNDSGLDVIGAIIGAACLDSITFVEEMIAGDLKGFATRD